MKGAAECRGYENGSCSWYWIVRATSAISGFKSEAAAGALRDRTSGLGAAPERGERRWRALYAAQPRKRDDSCSYGAAPLRRSRVISDQFSVSSPYLSQCSRIHGSNRAAHNVTLYIAPLDWWSIRLCKDFPQSQVYAVQFICTKLLGDYQNNLSSVNKRVHPATVQAARGVRTYGRSGVRVILCMCDCVVSSQISIGLCVKILVLFRSRSSWTCKDKATVR